MPSQTQELLRRVWQGQNTFATTALVTFIDRYGDEALNWEPETVELEIETDFRVDIHPAVFDRLMAGIALLRDNSFYIRLPDFMHICGVLSGERVAPETVPVLEVSDVAWGVTEALLLSPPDTDNLKKEFDPEIVGFVENLLNYYRFISAPDSLLKLVTAENLKFIEPGFENDPNMFAGMYQNTRAQIDEVNEIVKGRLVGLCTQLKILPLESQKSAQKVTQIVDKLLSLEHLRGVKPIFLYEEASPELN